MRRDYDRALAEIREADLDQFHIYHGVAAIIYAELGMVAEATEAGRRFARMNPGFLANLDAELAKRNFRPEDRARLAAGLRKAGVSVPTRAAMAAECRLPRCLGPGTDHAGDRAVHPVRGKPARARSGT
jgi:hypothetical protein